MAVIRSNLNTRTDRFRENAVYNRALIADLRDTVAAIKQGGPERARERHLARGKPLPRGRPRTRHFVTTSKKTPVHRIRECCGFRGPMPIQLSLSTFGRSHARNPG